MSATQHRVRPLSPHLSIYRMTRYSMLSSISNRFTGLMLSVGLIPLAYWLVALAAGPAGYARAVAVLGSWPLKVLYALLLFAFAYHLIAGIRHLVWDTGHGLERRQSQRSAHFIIAAALVLGALLCAWSFAVHGAVL